MFLSLGQIAQATTVTIWQGQVAPAQTALLAKDWAALASLADAIAKKAADAKVATVATTAQAVQKAALAMSSGGVADDVAKAVTALTTVAQLEDAATDGDRVLSGQLILQQISVLNSNIAAFMAKHSGAYALWDRLKGGADVSSLMDQVKEIQDTINATPLTVLGRQELQARLAQAVASIKPEVDWGTIAVGLGTVGGLAAAKWLLGKAQAAAASRVQAHVSKTALGKKFGLGAEKKPKKKRKKAKAE